MIDLNKYNIIIIDFETFYNSKDKYTLSNKKMSMVEYIRDLRFFVHGMGIAKLGEKAEWVGADEVRYVLDAIDWPRTAVIAHNAKFDGYILTQHYGVSPALWLDTKGMSRAVLGKRVKNHSLATIANHFGLQPKGDLKTDGIERLTKAQERELAEYCLHDVDLTGEIFRLLQLNFPSTQYDFLHWTIQTFVNPKLQLNIKLLEEAAKSEAERKAKIFDELGIDKKIFSSNVKFPKLLKEREFEVPIKVSPRTQKEIPALALGDPEFLDMLNSENEELRTLCEARVAAKSTLLETRSTKLARIGKTGKWSFDVEFSGASQTHRHSGGKGAGGNPQNFTRGSVLRQAVEAPKGYTLIVGDFTGIELRLVAYLSRDRGLVQGIETGTDLYCDFASVFFGRPITKKDDKERRFGKCAILGLGYGMGASKFRHTVRIQTGEKISEEDAQKAVDLYRKRYRNVPELWHSLNLFIPNLTTPECSGPVLHLPIRFEHEALILPSGLKIKYPNLRERDGEWVFDVWRKKSEIETTKLYGGKILENVSQALAGELCKSAAGKFGDNITGLVHDEIHLLSPCHLSSIFKKRLESVMSASPEWMPNMKVNAEVGAGPNWLHAK